MDELKQLEKIQELERQIAGLPIGTSQRRRSTAKSDTTISGQRTEKSTANIFEMERWRYCRNKLIGASLFKLN